MERKRLWMPEIDDTRNNWVRIEMTPEDTQQGLHKASEIPGSTDGYLLLPLMFVHKGFTWAIIIHIQVHLWTSAATDAESVLEIAQYADESESALLLLSCVHTICSTLLPVNWPVISGFILWWIWMLRDSIIHWLGTSPESINFWSNIATRISQHHKGDLW